MIPIGTPKGTKIRCVKRYFGNETEGKIYELREDHKDKTCMIYITKDDTGTGNAYLSEHFELASASEVATPVPVPEASDACQCGHDKHGLGWSSWCPAIDKHERKEYL